MTETLTGKNIVGALLTGEGKKVFYGENPSESKRLEPGFYEATLEEADTAIEKAAEAFQVYRNKTGKEKAIFLENIAEEILALGDALIQRCMQETGLPEARLAGERARTVNQLKLFATLLRDGSWVEARIDTAQPDRQPVPKPDVRSMLRPLGPVGIFGASNFPFAFSVAGGDSASALAAGCSVVFKAHPSHPGTSEFVGLAIQRAVQKSNMPEGTFSMLHSQSTEIGLHIVRHSAIKAIGFTGSFKGGKAIFDEANKREVPIPVYAEMGSSNPVFILPGALKERNESIAKDLAASVNLGAGQFCTSPGLVFIQESGEATTFKEKVSAIIGSLESSVMLSAGIQHNYAKGIDKLTKTNGVKILAQGKSEGEGSRGVSYFMESDADHFLRDKKLEEEVFGPATLTISANNKDQLLEAAKNLTGHLTVTVHGTEDDLKEYEDLIAILEQKAGRILINGYPTGVEVCHAMVHGGPYPATTDSRSTSVGTLAIKRFTRPVCYQNFPEFLLPIELRNENILKIFRLIDGTNSQ
jgi:2,5-dioxopentanoate dehydrogenase